MIRGGGDKDGWEMQLACCCYEDTRCWTAFTCGVWMGYEGCEGYGTADGLSQPRMDWQKEAIHIAIWAVQHV